MLRPTAIPPATLERAIRLLQLEPHAAQDLGRLRELDVGVGHDLDLVAPRIEERVAAQDLHAGLARSREHGLLVVDDEPEVALCVLRRGGPLHQREELVAQVTKATPALRPRSSSSNRAP